MKKLDYNVDKVIRNILIVLSLISIFSVILNFTNAIYSDHDTAKLQSFLNVINGPIMWIDGILLYLFSILYIISAIQSKCERIIKISFSVLAILTNIITITFFVNIFASLFSII